MKIDKSGPCVFEGCTSTRIENRTKWLCQEHNHLRRHGETIQNTNNRKQQEYLVRSREKQKNKVPTKVTKVYHIPNATKKESKTKDELSKLKLKIRQDATDNDRYYCWGCGNGGEGLDCSHILSVRERKDLECVEENINLFCRDCHNRWESNDIEQMFELLTFEKDLEFIRVNDTKMYTKIIYKLKEWLRYLDSIEDELLYKKIQNITTKSLL